MNTNNLKNRNDIGYLQFLDYTKAIAGKEALEVNAITASFFGIGLVDFNNVLNNQEGHKFKYNLRFKKEKDFKTAGEFIDADTYIERQDIASFLRLAIKRRWWQRKLNVDKIGLQDGEYIVGFFLTLRNK